MAHEDLDFKCLVCGEELPTVVRREKRRGRGYAGDYEIDVTYHDPSYEIYFVLVTNPELLKNSHQI